MKEKTVLTAEGRLQHFFNIARVSIKERLVIQEIVDQAIREAVEAERESCALVADEWKATYKRLHEKAKAIHGDDGKDALYRFFAADDIAAAIRRRNGDETPLIRKRGQP